MSQSTRRTVTFEEPRTVTVVEEPLPTPASGEVRVRTIMSAISPGTERLVYRGEVPSSLQADPTIDALSGDLTFPLAYGYAAVGRVETCGTDVPDRWIGRRVFSFQPHTSHFVASPDHLIPLPEQVSLEDGVMIPSVETAVNLLMDGRPMIGERVVLFGQGVVGLLVTALLSRHPVSDLYTVEPNPERRARSEEWGAQQSFHPENDWKALRNRLGRSEEQSQASDSIRVDGADLVYELSGHPSALDSSVIITGFDGRIIVGSWYGTKVTDLQLGGRFHRARIQLKSSQVSTIDPDYRGRWTKERRMTVVRNLLDSIQPGSLISDTVPVEEAPSVYKMLDDEEKGILQPVFQYS